jgi:hypothetical protein
MFPAAGPPGAKTQPDFPTCQDKDRRAIAPPARSWAVFFQPLRFKSPFSGSRLCSPMLAIAGQNRVIAGLYGSYMGQAPDPFLTRFRRSLDPAHAQPSESQASASLSVHTGGDSWASVSAPAPDWQGAEFPATGTDSDLLWSGSSPPACPP